MKYSSRFFLLAPVTLFLCFLAVAGVHWWLVADAFSAFLAKANGHEIAPGVTMRFASRQISGFPFSLDTVFRDVSFDVATPQGPIIWRTQNFAMHALTYGRDQTIFEAAGKQELDWTKADGEKRALPFAVGSLHASSIVDKSGVERFDLDLVGFGSKDFTAQRLQFHIKRDKADTLDVAAMADGVRAPGYAAKSEVLEGTADEAHALDGLRDGAERWYDALEHWRKAGGKLHVANAMFDFCGVPMKGRGDLALDGAHRIDGSLDSKATEITHIVSGKFFPPSGCPATNVVLDEVTDGVFVGLKSLGPLY